MKKVFIIFISLLMAISVFTSCKKAENPQESDITEETEEISEESMEEITESWEMILKQPRDDLYRITYQTEAGEMSMTILKKQWGTWNLGAWQLTDENGICSFVTGSTDMEYVYRSAKKGDPGWVWSGGNHGNEKLVSLEFYNDITGEKMDIVSGDEYLVERIRVVENTKLHWGDENDTYCDVIRTYIIVGKKVTFTVDYKYTQDCMHYLSYTCMFPINKKYGLYADMIGKDGKKVTTVVTEKVGKADYSGPMHSGNAATEAVIYGYVNDKYSFDVKVNTHKDSLNDLDNDYKTAFWDMNTDTNKLYFSKYFLDKATEVKAGTEFHTECSWEFLIDGK